MTGERPRLTRATQLPQEVGLPVQPTSNGIVHIGVGAFHRAHQAVFTQDAMRASGDRRWGILGTTQRSPLVAQCLEPQGGAFTVLTVDSETSSAEVVGSVTRVLVPDSDTVRIIECIQSPSTQVITITVTEKGYTMGPGGGLDLRPLANDLATLAAEEREGSLDPQPTSSMLGLLMRGLAARRRARAGPITVLSCDNMVGNGAVLERLVRAGVASIKNGEALQAWLDQHVTFPSSVVDRIVPATTHEVLDSVERMIGARDEGAVVAEPYRSWIIEDRFAAERPPWELAGVQFVSDVAPFEEAKLRMLNGTHSILAFAGLLRGHRTIDSALADPMVRASAEAYLFGDALPSVHSVPGVDLNDYAQTILRRFANTALGHSTTQVGSDASLKIPQRWIPVALDRLNEGVVPLGVAEAVATWAAAVIRHPQALQDPMRNDIAAAVTRAHGEQEALLALLSLPTIFPFAVGSNEAFRNACANMLPRLLR